jgi:hypothetical protein
LATGEREGKQRNKYAAVPVLGSVDVAVKALSEDWVVRDQMIELAVKSRTVRDDVDMLFGKLWGNREARSGAK